MLGEDLCTASESELREMVGNLVVAMDPVSDSVVLKMFIVKMSEVVVTPGW